MTSQWRPAGWKYWE